jgi:hypothetical protein
VATSAALDGPHGLAECGRFEMSKNRVVVVVIENVGYGQEGCS